MRVRRPPASLGRRRSQRRSGSGGRADWCKRSRSQGCEPGLGKCSTCMSSLSRDWRATCPLKPRPWPPWLVSPRPQPPCRLAAPASRSCWRGARARTRAWISAPSLPPSTARPSRLAQFAAARPTRHGSACTSGLCKPPRAEGCGPCLGKCWTRMPSPSRAWTSSNGPIDSGFGSVMAALVGPPRSQPPYQLAAHASPACWRAARAWTRAWIWTPSLSPSAPRSSQCGRSSSLHPKWYEEACTRGSHTSPRTMDLRARRRVDFQGKKGRDGLAGLEPGFIRSLVVLPLHVGLVQTHSTIVRWTPPLPPGVRAACKRANFPRSEYPLHAPGAMVHRLPGVV